MTQTQPCPCGSEKNTSECCLPIIQGKLKAPTAERLMRARYTAFTRGDIDFIVKSHHSKTIGDVNRQEIEDWSKNSKWLGLKVLQTQEGGEQDDKGVVVFHARYEAEGKEQDHYEYSQFEREGGAWKFYDAQGLKPGPIRRESPKIGRNDPCSCGSGKKFKKCCGTP